MIMLPKATNSLSRILHWWMTRLFPHWKLEHPTVAQIVHWFAWRHGPLYVTQGYKILYSGCHCRRSRGFVAPEGVSAMIGIAASAAGTGDLGLSTGLGASSDTGASAGGFGSGCAVRGLQKWYPCGLYEYKKMALLLVGAELFFAKKKSTCTVLLTYCC